MSKQQGYHPNIGSIIRLRDQSYQSLYVERDYEKTINQMSGMVALLKPDDKEGLGDLGKKLLNEISYYDTMNSDHKKQSRRRKRRVVYHAWFEQINDILWSKGYLENAKYGVETKLDTTFKDVTPWNEEE